MNEAEARDYVASQQWIFAKTYAETLPHEYIVFPFKRPADRDEYRAFEAWIRSDYDTETRLGYPARVLDDHYYWVIHPVINRAPRGAPHLDLEGQDGPG